MKEITQENYTHLIKGSTFLGTGGGGSPEDAERMMKKIVMQFKNIKIRSLKDLKKTDLMITAFGIGPITKSGDPERPLKKALHEIEKKIKTKIRGIIPVEIGPESLSDACLIASVLNTPLIDADMVGGRSAPEVYFETISLYNIPRTPLAIADSDGNCAVLDSARSYKEEEIFLRSFSLLSQTGTAFVVGYPMTVQTAQKTIESGTVTDALHIGKLLEDGMHEELYKKYKVQKIHEGKIVKIIREKIKGFTQKTIEIHGADNNAKVFIKNENLIVWIDGKVIVTCPDSIIIVNDKDMPLYNLDLKKGMAIKILSLPARKKWQTKKGRELFSPKKFGFSFESKSLKDSLLKKRKNF